MSAYRPCEAKPLSRFNSINRVDPLSGGGYWAIYFFGSVYLKSRVFICPMTVKSVTILSIKPCTYPRTLPEGFTAYYKPYSYELVLEGGYHEFAHFINNIENYSTLMEINSLSIFPNENNERVHDITLILSVYTKV